MTREDAIYWIKNLAVLSSEKDIANITEALDMAIEALQQQRKAILPKHCIVPSGDYAATAGMPKRGKWILGKEISREYIGDICVGVEYDGWQCSSCKTKVEKPYKPNWNYCPNCGAKMEVEE